MSLYLSRLQLSRDPSVAALAALIDPKFPGRREDAHHRLLWSIFSGDSTQSRDFLWRDEGNGRFIVISRRPPGDNRLFDQPEVKVFFPDLKPGDVLDFILRANATRTVKSDQIAPNGKRKRKHYDIVMDALYSVKSARAECRMDLAQPAAQGWLERQGEQHGFALRNCQVQDYFTRALPSYQGPRKNQPQFGVLDLTGRIEIREPTAFLTKLALGFGRARAFGCGLMLIRRA